MWECREWWERWELEFESWKRKPEFEYWQQWKRELERGQWVQRGRKREVCRRQ